MSRDDDFDTTPSPAFLRAMQNQRWTVHGALAELVDNSFGAGRGDARTVVITHDPKKHTIEVLDNGRGMDALGRLFKFGDTIGRSPNDIGMYGAGGTMAILWLAKRVRIWTLRDGMISHDSADWPDWFKSRTFPKISNKWRRATAANSPDRLFALGHGTMISLTLLRERRVHSSNVQRDLAEIYAPALLLGKRLIWRVENVDRDLTALLPTFTDPAKSLIFDLVLELPSGEHLPVHGKIGIVEDLPHSRSRIHVGFGPRVIKSTRDCFVAPNGGAAYIGTGVTGWLQLGDGWQPFLATTKDAMNDTPAWECLMAHVHEQIKPLLEKTDRHEFSLILDEIGIQLEQALNGSSKIEIDVDGERHQHRENTESAPKPEPAAEPDPTPRPAPEPEPNNVAGDRTTQDKAAHTRLTIMQDSDEDMEGVLCRVEAVGHELLISVNRDHRVVQEAIIKKPINRMLLNILVMAEIAAFVEQNPSLLRRLFGPRVARTIENRERDLQRPLITRILMDRIVTDRQEIESGNLVH